MILFTIGFRVHPRWFASTGLWSCHAGGSFDDLAASTRVLLPDTICGLTEPYPQISGNKASISIPAIAGTLRKRWVGQAGNGNHQNGSGNPLNGLFPERNDSLSTKCCAWEIRMLSKNWRTSWRTQTYLKTFLLSNKRYLYGKSSINQILQLGPIGFALRKIWHCIGEYLSNRRQFMTIRWSIQTESYWAMPPGSKKHWLCSGIRMIEDGFIDIGFYSGMLKPNR